MSLDPKLEALSDEFQSTFTRVGSDRLANCFDENELDAVAALVKKHMGADEVRFERMLALGSGSYGLWEIVYK